MRKLTNLLICVLTGCWACSVLAQSTIFNYQGRLALNGSAANGLYDFQFTIFKVETNGIIIAGPMTNTAVAVSNGLFNVALDFGQQPFLGVNRWLDIAVRTNGTGAFSALIPRIRIASAPYAIAAANVIDGAVTAESLSPGPGPEGQVLKMSNGVLTWAPDLNSGGGVTSVATGTGLLGGPITNSGTLSINPAIVPFLNGSQTFSGSNIFAGVSALTNSQNKFVGAFFGNGAGITNINTTATNVNITLSGDVTGPSSASTVARIRSVNVLATAPTAGQHLRFSGTDWTPAAVALATDVSGTLADARLSANVALLNANQTFSGSNTFNGVASMTNVNNRFSGAFTGNGIGLTTLNAANLSLGTLADARLSANVPLLSGNQTFAGSNAFNGVASMTNVNNRFVGAFFGNGAGLSNIVTSSTNTSVTLAGDVTGPSSAATVARIRSVNVLATAPTAGQHLRFSGTDWTPASVALATDVSGTLADARLSANVPLLNGNQTFSSSNIFNGVSLFLNGNNSFAGNGANLTALNAANITSGTLTDARLSANVPLLNGNQTFAGSNTFNGVASLTNVNNKFVGAFFGNGAGLTNIVVSSTNTSVTLAGDVTGPSSAAIVARIRSVNVLATAPTAGQHLRFSGTDWTPASVALATDVSGTLADARLSANVPLLNGNQTFSSSNIFNGVSLFLNGNNSFAGNGANLTALNAANITSGTLTDARLSANVPLLNGNQTFAGSNTFNGVASLTNVNNKFVGAFFGNGAGLTNIVVSSTNTSVTLAGDVTGPSSAATVARIRSVNVLATAPTTGQVLRFSGTDWTPAAVALATDVSGTLADAHLSANVTLLNGNQTFSGSNTFNGATLMTNGNNRFTGAFVGTGIGLTTLNAANLALGTLPDARLSANVPLLTVSNRFSGAFVGNGAGLTNVTATSNLFGQFSSGSALNGLFVENTATNDGSSALVGSAPATSGVTFGVFGQVASPDGTGVQGLAYGSTNGNSTGVYGQSISTNGTGVVGVGSAQSGQPIGVYGEADAPLGIGVYGLGAASSGVPVGVYGTVSGTNGYGFYTPNNLFVGGSALLGALRVSGGTVFTGTNTFTKLLLASGSSNSPAIAFTNSPAAGLFNPGTNILGLATSGTNRIYIAADGKVGIGRTPTANLLEVEGTASKASSGQWLANSDARIKTGVQNLDHALATIERVRPVSFNYTDEYRTAHPSIENKKYYNVIAQEFARVFPDAVKESGEMLDGKPILQVDVHPAAIYAIAAIQELHGLLIAKDDDLAKLKEQNIALEKRLQTLEKVVSGLAR